MGSALDTLTQINLDDLVGAFGWQPYPLLSAAARALFRKPAHDFACQMLAFDEAMGMRGLVEAACLTERLYVRDVRVFGAQRIPEGPCLFLSNHPGMTDTLALFAALARTDLRAIAIDRPFLLSLPNLAQHLEFVTDQPYERVSMVRRVSRHLHGGGSVLTFPAGHTEPDPDVYPGAIESLHTWIDSAGVFVRLAPATAVVPVCVRGVCWPAIANHPITRLRRTVDDRQLLSSAIQLLANVALHVRPVTATIQVGEPFFARDLGSADTWTMHHAVLDSMTSLLESNPEGDGQSAL